MVFGGERISDLVNQCFCLRLFDPPLSLDRWSSVSGMHDPSCANKQRNRNPCSSSNGSGGWVLGCPEAAQATVGDHPVCNLLGGVGSLVYSLAQVNNLTSVITKNPV